MEVKLGLRATKKARTRLAISDVATRLFVARGFEHVTVAEIAAAADVSVKTVFNYFPAKEDLFFDRADELLAGLLRTIAERPAGRTITAALHGLLAENRVPFPGAGWRRAARPRRLRGLPRLRGGRARLAGAARAAPGHRRGLDGRPRRGARRRERPPARRPARGRPSPRCSSRSWGCASACCPAAVLERRAARTVERRVRAIVDEAVGRLAAAFADLDRPGLTGASPGAGPTPTARPSTSSPEAAARCRPPGAGSVTAMHRVVVVGGGFGGLQAAQHLKDAPVEVTLVDRRNFHLFQPLVYQVATGALSPGEIAAPLRSLFKHDGNVRVVLGEVTDFDLAGAHGHGRWPAPSAHEQLGSGYDTLIVAGGSAYSYFGHDEWRPFAPEIKSLESAVDIRRADPGRLRGRRGRDPPRAPRGAADVRRRRRRADRGRDGGADRRDRARHAARELPRDQPGARARILLVEVGRPRAPGLPARSSPHKAERAPCAARRDAAARRTP